MMNDVDTKMTNQRRSLAPLYCYIILKRETDPQHPMSQGMLLQRLQQEYGISMGRQACARCLRAMNDSEVNIFYRSQQGKSMTWYDRHPW